MDGIPQIEDHIGLAYTFALIFARLNKLQYADVEDAKQESLLALDRAVKRFDVNRGVPFSGYAKRAIISWLYRWWHRRGLIRIPDRLKKHKQTNFVPLHWNSALNEEETGLSVILEDLLSIVEKLPEKQKDIIKKRYGLHGIEKETLEVIGKRYGHTKEWVRQQQLKAERTINDLLNGL